MFFLPTQRRWTVSLRGNYAAPVTVTVSASAALAARAAPSPCSLGADQLAVVVAWAVVFFTCCLCCGCQARLAVGDNAAARGEGAVKVVRSVTRHPSAGPRLMLSLWLCKVGPGDWRQVRDDFLVALVLILSAPCACCDEVVLPFGPGVHQPDTRLDGSTQQ